MIFVLWEIATIVPQITFLIYFHRVVGGNWFSIPLSINRSTKLLMTDCESISVITSLEYLSLQNVKLL